MRKPIINAFDAFQVFIVHLINFHLLHLHVAGSLPPVFLSAVDFGETKKNGTFKPNPMNKPFQTQEIIANLLRKVHRWFTKHAWCESCVLSQRWKAKTIPIPFPKHKSINLIQPPTITHKNSMPGKVYSPAASSRSVWELARHCQDSPSFPSQETKIHCGVDVRCEAQHCSWNFTEKLSCTNIELWSSQMPYGIERIIGERSYK